VNILKADINPTPRPAKKRPATKSGIATEAVCKITPKLNTTRVTISPRLLPMKSASGAAARAPKNVPADKMETIKDDCPAVISGLFVSGFLKPVENVSSHAGIAMMPPMVPVSYLGYPKLVEEMREDVRRVSPKENSAKGYK
jgi:hypothetical protein